MKRIISDVQNIYRRKKFKRKKGRPFAGDAQKALALGPLHGLGVSRRIEQMSKGASQVKPGSLFPALQRMEEAGWLRSTWAESENNRRAKYYRLTKTGQRQVKNETEDWQRISLAIANPLQSS
jgi:PadR family transcriptional regulator PadR